MNILIKAIIAIIVNCLLISSVLAVGNAQGTNGHHDHDKPINQNVDGKKWLADTHLQQGMKNIDTAVNKASKTLHHGSLTLGEVDTLSSYIKAEVELIVVNCKLEPEADAILHGLIHEMLTGVDHLLENPKSPNGLSKISDVLQKYQQHFFSKNATDLKDGGG